MDADRRSTAGRIVEHFLGPRPRHSKPLQAEAEALGLDRKTLTRRLDEMASAVLEAHHLCILELLTFMLQLFRQKIYNAIAAFFFASFDETPTNLRVGQLPRVPGGEERRKRRKNIITSTTALKVRGVEATVDQRQFALAGKLLRHHWWVELFTASLAD